MNAITIEPETTSVGGCDNVVHLQALRSGAVEIEQIGARNVIFIPREEIPKVIEFLAAQMPNQGILSALDVFFGKTK